HEAGAGQLASVDQTLSEGALTIGFARRFATYKRATLLFRDIDRLARIVNDPERPVQFIFAGKAHPADNPGKEFIQAIYRLSQDPRLAGRIVFIEDYDMNVARHLVQGCDIWLNNPRRPLEASGTSGEKASLNGCINFSVLDGWWREAWDGTNGWPIGEEREYRDLNVQDEADSLSLYDTLERQIVPLYYSDRDGLPEQWLQWVRNAIRTVAPQYSMQRQVQDYVKTLYTPAQQRGAALTGGSFEAARELARWKLEARSAWNSVRVEARMEPAAEPTPGSPIPVVARVYPGSISPRDIRVEALITREGNGRIEECRPLELAESGDGWAEYRGNAIIPEAGAFEVSVRALPYREKLAYPLELGLVSYA
ncbi:MAG TPA: alpha-glucan family phosphorylase, partial [Deinococcales bacterium]|nr:alpha-glucan family phosphorylase [Deinococcales bacterium]